MSASAFFLLTACGEGLWRILRACGKGAVGCTRRACAAPQPPLHHTRARFDSECKRWNLEHVVLDLFSHIKTGKIQWFLLQSSLSLVVAQASAIWSNCLHRLPNCLLSVMIKCAAVSEEAAASDILVGAQPRIRCWARTRSSSSELIDTATARRQQRVEDATRVGLQFPFRPERASQ